MAYEDGTEVLVGCGTSAAPNVTDTSWPGVPDGLEIDGVEQGTPTWHGSSAASRLPS